ncbi:MULTISPECIES: WGR domain-containing protein [Rhizobium/Agrobacterium group]|uniref:WGR domain-containing protein n=1 Tax=Rhizobium/Agrobacterium group TaxID=227290 RepID=UPI00181AD352|nr:MULTISPECIES: WGR domain-containing protein [Rhizobium/Agrobacterium group]MBB4403011.1 putative DNA-binding WGR domain protein [Agrobacterium radiobacter]MBB5589079.1 putative DNA-binding WGR domain protein [Agrobacterium radiobacter]
MPLQGASLNPSFRKPPDQTPPIITAMNRSGWIDSKKSLDGSAEGRETPVMENEDTGTIHLRRIDPSQNMRRFYVLAIQPTLFGGASVIRHWGRIGTIGQSKIETFDSDHDAATAAMRLQKAKRRRGYRDDGTT